MNVLTAKHLATREISMSNIATEAEKPAATAQPESETKAKKPAKGAKAAKKAKASKKAKSPARRAPTSPRPSARTRKPRSSP